MQVSKLFAPVLLSAFVLTAYGAEPAKKPEAAKPAASAPAKKPEAQLGKDAKPAAPAPAPAAAPAPAPAAPAKK